MVSSKVGVVFLVLVGVCAVAIGKDIPDDLDPRAQIAQHNNDNGQLRETDVLGMHIFESYLNVKRFIKKVIIFCNRSRRRCEHIRWSLFRRGRAGGPQNSSRVSTIARVQFGAYTCTFVFFKIEMHLISDGVLNLYFRKPCPQAHTGPGRGLWFWT